MADDQIQISITAEVDDLQRQLALAQRSLAETAAEFDDLSGQMTSAATAALASLKSAFAELPASYAEQVQESAAYWQKILATQKHSAQERREVETELANAQRELDQQTLAFEQQLLGQKLRLGEEKLRTEEAQAREALADGRITAEQEYQESVRIENAKIALIREVNAERLLSAQGDFAATSRIRNEDEIAEERHTQALLRLDERYFQSKQKLERQDGQTWRAALQEIESAEDQLVRSIFSSRQRLSTSLLQLSAQFIEKELANDLKYLTVRQIYLAMGSTEEAKRIQGGLATHLAAELFKTGATVRGETARSAIRSVTAARESGIETASTAQHALAETAKTEATEVGNALRNDSDVAAAGVSAAAESSATKESIFKHAWSAAAAVYDDVSQIPYVGWILAPPAAAAAAAAVLAFGDAIPSSAGGLWTVPQDTLAMVHAQETILPANIASPMRAFFEGGGAAAGQGAGSPGVSAGDMHVHVHAADSRDAMNFFKRNASALSEVLLGEIRNGNPRLRRAIAAAR